MGVPVLSAPIVAANGTFTATLNETGCSFTTPTTMSVSGGDSFSTILGATISGTTITFALDYPIYASQAFSLTITAGSILSGDSSPLPIVPAVLSVTNNATLIASLPTNFRVFSGNGKLVVRWDRTDPNVYIGVYKDGNLIAGPFNDSHRPYTISGLTNWHSYSIQIYAIAYTAPFFSAQDSGLSVPLQEMPHPLSSDEEFWAALVAAGDANTEIRDRFPGGVYVDHAQVAQPFPTLLATDFGGITEETTEDATAVHEVQFDIWASDDLTCRRAVQEVINVYRNQILPIAGAGPALLAMRPQVSKEADDDIGTVWRGSFRLQFYVDEVSNMD